MATLSQLPNAPASFEVWAVQLDEEPHASELACLSDPERARAARFVFPVHRRRYLAAHCALRQVLSARTGVSPGALRFGEGPFGKPHLTGGISCSFNLSHSGGHALIALADEGEIGIDLEIPRHVPDAIELGERNFTASEQARLRATSATERDLAFLTGWTRKEACLKAIGSGLSIEPRIFEAGLSGDPRDTVIHTPDGDTRVRVHSFRCGAGIAAVARVLERKLPQ